jgi:hypothetical protein
VPSYGRQQTKEGAVARARAKSDLTTEQLAYLAGIFEAYDGLKSTSSTNAVAISRSEEWPAYMAKTYGGTADRFTSKAGKVYWGWFVPIKRRLQIADMLEKAGVCHTIEPTTWDGIKHKLERAIPLEQRDDD